MPLRLPLCVGCRSRFPRGGLSRSLRGTHRSTLSLPHLDRAAFSLFGLAHQHPNGEQPTSLDAAQAGGVLHHQCRVAIPVPRRQTRLAQLRPGSLGDGARQQRRHRVA
ncbi:hypothetical protein E3T51_02345 [Cryobacterium serini]|uniref:Uncharacterized protein n=1 Tax=Cryobacterium serini TaxID=1259201 RepID=A0A4R9BSU6_9MICO|nr:hypothetical protein E3T51_02345 [Cryobacterium serini]